MKALRHLVQDALFGSLYVRLCQPLGMSFLMSSRRSSRRGGCPGYREELSVEPYIRAGEHASSFIAHLKCSTCRRMPDSILLCRLAPNREIILFRPGRISSDRAH
jgi:hypothetical protein